MAKVSPRVENGIIKWYCGDAFYINFELIDDNTNEPITLNPKDTVTVSFYNKQLLLVKRFIFGGGADCGCLRCHICKDTTKGFLVGRYTYDIKYYNDTEKTISTVKDNGQCEVERCH